VVVAGGAWPRVHTLCRQRQRSPGWFLATSALRHDLQQLSDRGLLSGPTLSWPIGWSQVAREARKLDTAGLSVGELASVERLRARAAREMRPGDAALVATVSGAVNPTQLRTFESTPREEGEATLSADWLDQRFA